MCLGIITETHLLWNNESDRAKKHHWKGHRSPNRVVPEQHPGIISTTAVTKGALLLPMEEHTEHRTQYLVVMRTLLTLSSPDLSFKILEMWEIHLQFLRAVRFADPLISPLLPKLSAHCGCLPCRQLSCDAALYKGTEGSRHLLEERWHWAGAGVLLLNVYLKGRDQFNQSLRNCC